MELPRSCGLFVTFPDVDFLDDAFHAQAGRSGKGQPRVDPRLAQPAMVDQARHLRLALAERAVQCQQVDTAWPIRAGLPDWPLLRGFPGLLFRSVQLSRFKRPLK